MKLAIIAITGIAAAVPDIIEVVAQCLFHWNATNPSPLWLSANPQSIGLF